MLAGYKTRDIETDLDEASRCHSKYFEYWYFCPMTAFGSTWLPAGIPFATMQQAIYICTDACRDAVHRISRSVT